MQVTTLAQNSEIIYENNVMRETGETENKSFLRQGMHLNSKLRTE